MWGVSDYENITDWGFTRFSQRKISFTDLNHKLCANEDIILTTMYVLMYQQMDTIEVQDPV